MRNEICDAFKRLADPTIGELGVMHWASPILAFGNPLLSKIATLGLNPSDKEFIDDNGNELTNSNRRFQTLKSVGISKWDEVNEEQIKLIEDQCNEYFIRKPYDGWFKRLDFLISGTSLSYYFPSMEACHLDLVPYATSIKWGNLSTSQKTRLLNNYGDFLGRIIKMSENLTVLVLNGKTVIDNLQKISDVSFIVNEEPRWNLPRENTNDIKGYSYEGHLSKIGGIELGKKILALGFNHNIQSSFGVTSTVQQEIRNWISEKTKKYL